MTNIYQVTVVYPNETHNRTECFDDETDASILFDDLFEEREGKEYIAIFLHRIDFEKVQTHIDSYWKRPKS